MTTYRERLTAPLSWWLAALAFALVWGWVFLVITNWSTAIIVSAIIAAVGFFAVSRYGSLLITVDQDGLRVGTAFLEPAHLGAATALSRADYRTRLGIDADARAHLVTRPYLDHGVMVTIDDPTDPTPYWLVSSRRSAELAAALAAGGIAPHSVHDTIGDTPRGKEEV